MGLTMRNISIWMTVLAGIGLPVWAQDVPQNSAKATAQAAMTEPAGAATLEQAKELAAKGRLEPAMTILNTLAGATPEEAGVEHLRGLILYQREQLPEAEKALAKAVEQDPKDMEALEMRGVTVFRLGHPEQAIPMLEAAHAAVAATNVDPQYVLGLCYVDTKRYDDARRAFAGQFGFETDSPEAYLVTARLLLRREFTDKATEFAQKALELRATLPLAHQLLGEVALAKGDLPKAVSELEAEAKLNPLNGMLYDRLGDAYVRNGQYEQARQALNKAVLLEPNATGPYILLGEALVKLGDPVQAMHYLNRAVTMDPGNYITHTILGQAYRALGQMGDANREYKLAVEIQHKNDPKPAGAKQ